MSGSANPEYERRLLTPIKTFNIKSSKIPKSKSVEILLNGKSIYSISVSSTPFSSKTNVSILRSDSKSTLATAMLSSREDDFVLLLGDQNANEPIKIEQDMNANMLDKNFKFMLDGQKYAWQCICRHSIRIPTSDGCGIIEETNGQDWKLVKLSGMEPKIDDSILAAHSREKNDSSFHGESGAANLHWFATVSDDVEEGSLGVIMGMLERERRSAKEWSSGTSLLFG